MSPALVLCLSLVVGAVALSLPGQATAQEKGYVGVEVRNLEQAEAEALGWEEPRGAMVVAVQTGSPAVDAGIETGDVIVSVDGQEAENIQAFVDAVIGKQPRSEVNLRLLRNGKERRVKLVVGVRPRELDTTSGGRKCSKYSPSIGRAIEVPCPE